MAKPKTMQKKAPKARPASAVKTKAPAKSAKTMRAAKSAPPTRASKSKAPPAVAPARKPKPAPARKPTAASKQAPAAPPAAAQRSSKIPPALKHLARVPKGAEELKARLGTLSGKVAQIKTLRRALNKNFYDIGRLLGEIEKSRLFEVKGYGSFEAFVERELDLGKRLGIRIATVGETFIREAAERAGLERVLAALDALHGPDEESSGSFNVASGRAGVPIHKQ